MNLPYVYRDSMFESVLSKYIIKDEKTLEDVFTRCTDVPGISKSELSYAFSNGLVPQGSILFGLNNDLNCSLSNCYFIRTGDSIEEIMDTAKYAAITYKYRGGVGIDLTPLRPRGETVSNSAKTSSGAASFMDLYSHVTLTIGQAGRRGALMLTMADHHPDIFEFIRMKKIKGKVEGANVSVKISDELMNAVVNDTKFNLHWGGKIYKIINARDLFKEIVECAHASAEPGVIFWDRVKEWGPASYYIEPEGTNPCSEIPMPHGDACTLASIYLPVFIIDPYTNPKFDFTKFEIIIRTGIRFLDKIKDLDNCPFDWQLEMAQLYRRIGLGMHGFGDMLLRMGIRYGSDEALALLDKIGKFFVNISYSESARLASIDGPFPMYKKEIDLKCKWLKEVLTPDVYSEIMKYGRRNVQVNTIAPTGSISILCNNCSSGIEPVFMFEYNRTIRVHGKDDVIKVFHPEIEYYQEVTGHKIKDVSELPDYFVTSADIHYSNRIKMQATMTKYIDHSISSTVNLPAHTSIDTVNDLYIEAWRSGCKGITVYRDGCREGILNPIKTETGNIRDTPQELPAKRFKFKINEDNWYITITYDNNQPFDIMATSNTTNNSQIEDANHKLLYIISKYNLTNEFNLQVSKAKSDLDLFMRTISLLMRASISIDEIFAEIDCIVGSIPFFIKNILKTGKYDPNCSSGSCS